jgi:hypothetical protein
MDFKIKDNLLVARYFGELNPNTEEEILFYEKDLGIKGKGNIVYRYNNEGFRCDDFGVKKDGLHILFGGCSETEGAANELEDVWSHIVYSKIKESQQTSGYYNVGKAGLTISGIVMNVFQYIYDYGSPDYIFLQLPDQARYVTWSEKDSYHPKYQVRGQDIDNYGKDEFFKNHENAEVIKINILFNYFLLKNLIQVCESNNIKLIWSTWCIPSITKLAPDLAKLEGYIDTSTYTKEHWDIKIQDLRARDGWHFGKGFHKIWANKFYEEFLNDQSNKKIDS